MTSIAITTAAIMISMCFAMPTAVMTESSENTRSMATIWATIARGGGRRLSDLRLLFIRMPLQLHMNLMRRLANQEKAAEQEDQVPAIDFMVEAPRTTAW
jgi:hypothetical protein